MPQMVPEHFEIEEQQEEQQECFAFATRSECGPWLLMGVNKLLDEMNNVVDDAVAKLAKMRWAMLNIFDSQPQYRRNFMLDAMMLAAHTIPGSPYAQLLRLSKDNPNEYLLDLFRSIAVDTATDECQHLSVERFLVHCVWMFRTNSSSKVVTSSTGFHLKWSMFSMKDELLQRFIFRWSFLLIELPLKGGSLEPLNRNVRTSQRFVCLATVVLLRCLQFVVRLWQFSTMKNFKHEANFLPSTLQTHYGILIRNPIECVSTLRRFNAALGPTLSNCGDKRSRNRVRAAVLRCLEQRWRLRERTGLCDGRCTRLLVRSD